MLLLARHRQLWSHQNEPGALCPEFDPPQNYVERAAAVLVPVVPQIEAQTQLQLGPRLGPYEPQQLWQIDRSSAASLQTIRDS